MAKYTREHACTVCGVTFTPKRYDRTACCSRACGYVLQRRRGQQTRALSAEIEVYRGWARAAARRERASAVATSGSVARYVAARDVRARFFASQPCQVCESPVAYAGNGMPRRYCGAPCRKLSETTRANKRASRAVRKARERASTAEVFDPVDVLRRDGWRCHLCHCSTPERLRGTMHPRAPELDHIVPLARGGAHTRINTACACRSCNAGKGASLVG